MRHKTSYPPESAGRLMVSNVPTVHPDTTVDDIEHLLREKSPTFATVNYIYILGEQKQLTGVVSIKELYRAPKTTLAKDLLQEKLVTVRVHTDQERVAFLALEHTIKAVPVVDKEGAFLGVVPSDTILRVLHEEVTEDIAHFSGVLHPGTYDDIFQLPLTASLKHRLPWLIVGLFGGMLAAGIVGRFEELLSRNLILAAFIPLIVYMADAVGTQMEAFIIRDLAMNPKLKFMKYLAKQALIVLLIGLIVSAVLYGASLALYHDADISTVLATALFLATGTSLVTGLVVPYVFGRLNLDPANASGPIATVIQDVLSVLVYFAIASLVL
jgi:magnesium transporter